MTSGFIYEWIDLATGLKYIGKHEGSIDDGYIGSGTIFIKEYNSRPNDFQRKILWYKENITSDELSLQEEKYLNLIDDSNLYYGENRKYYNQVRNSVGYTSENNPMKNKDIVERMKETQKRLGYKNVWENTVGKYGLDKVREMKKQKMIGNSLGKGNKGKPKTEEHKRKIAKTIREISQNKPGSGGRKRKMPYDELLKLIAEHGILETAKILNESYQAARSRYYSAKKKLTHIE